VQAARVGEAELHRVTEGKKGRSWRESRDREKGKSFFKRGHHIDAEGTQSSSVPVTVPSESEADFTGYSILVCRPQWCVK